MILACSTTSFLYYYPAIPPPAHWIPSLQQCSRPSHETSALSSFLVSLLSLLSKIHYYAVYNQLPLCLTKNSPQDPVQSSFKAADFTETATVAITEKLHAAKSAKLFSSLQHSQSKDSLVHLHQSWN